MTDELDLTQATAAIEEATKEHAALRAAIQAGLGSATAAFAAQFQHAVDPEVLVAALMTEIHHLVIVWGAAQAQRPDDIEEYYASLMRQMRRLFRAQLAQALRGLEPQKRDTIQ